MKLYLASLEEVVPYENNPRFNDNAVQGVVDSIKECSYIQPIVVDENNVILAGHTRYKALQELGIKEVEILQIDGLTEEQKKKYRYLDNKTGEFAEWDIMKLTDELERLEMDELEFFNVEADNFDIETDEDFKGSIEYDAEEFDDERFEYECQNCGFRFNA